MPEAHAIYPNSEKSSHPFVYLILFLPFGIMSGYLTVTLAYLFSKAGISIEQIAILVAFSYVPQMLKFLWAPFVDVTLTVKKWYILSTGISAACILATSLVPVKVGSLPVLTVIIILSNIAVSFMAAAGNSLSAHDTPDQKKGMVSGFIQAGNMGGAGVGGGVGLLLAQHAPYIWISGAVLALTCLLCCLGLYFVKEPAATLKVKGAVKTISNVLRDVWETIKTKLGLLALILALMPIGTCAASNLFSAVAKDWHADADTVAMVTGIVGGIITGVSSLVGGWVCDLMDRKVAYLLIGLLQAASAIGMAFFPHTPTMYVIWTLVYSVTVGLTYAAYNAYTLEAIGKGAAATKFELYASISNVPIYLMTAVAGMAYSKWGANGMLNTEAVCCVAGVILFAVVQMVINRTRQCLLWFKANCYSLM